MKPYRRHQAAASAHHVLVVPRFDARRGHVHLRTCADLREADRPLLMRMASAGQAALDRRVAAADAAAARGGGGGGGGAEGGAGGKVRAGTAQQAAAVAASAVVQDVEASAVRTAGSPTGSVPAVFLFHRPPFNSIDHLHLHCIAEATPRRRCVTP